MALPNKCASHDEIVGLILRGSRVKPKNCRGGRRPRNKATRTYVRIYIHHSEPRANVHSNFILVYLLGERERGLLLTF